VPVYRRGGSPSAGSPSGRRALAPEVSEALSQLLRSVAKNEFVPVEFLTSVVLHESGGIATRVNKDSGAKGLMQLLKPAMHDVKKIYPVGLEWSGTELADPFDPMQNLTTGARYLVIVSARLGRDMTNPRTWPAIYAGYNLGVGNAVHVLGGNPERAADAIRKQGVRDPAAYFPKVQSIFAR